MSLGEEVRLTSEGVTGSALAAEGRVVYMALFPASPAPEVQLTAPPSRRRRLH